MEEDQNQEWICHSGYATGKEIGLGFRGTWDVQHFPGMIGFVEQVLLSLHESDPAPQRSVSVEDQIFWFDKLILEEPTFY